jgi:hypothetical protein
MSESFVPDEIEAGEGREVEESVEKRLADRQELDDRTLEPGSVIEQRQDIEQAEAIEASLKEAIDSTSQVQATPPIEVTAEPDSQHLDTDEDLVERKRPGSPVQVEELEVEGAAMEIKEQTDVDLKKGETLAEFPDESQLEAAIPLEEGEAELDGKGNDGVALDHKLISKIDSFTREADIAEYEDVGLDQKFHEGAELDGKEDDGIALDHKLISKIDSFAREADIAEVEDAGIDFKVTLHGVEIHPSSSNAEIEDVGIDFKFHEGTELGYASEESVGKDPAYLENLSDALSEANFDPAQAVIGRAAMDPSFREQLFTDPDTALEGYELSEEEHTAIRGVDRDEFEKISDELLNRLAGDTSDLQSIILEREMLDVLISTLSTELLE